ncbi:MAG: sulfotransferase [Candidatus Aminicenantes bacterium]|nr:sulfotransferase [Candidatus Aminicenantes bacterium]
MPLNKLFSLQFRPWIHGIKRAGFHEVSFFFDHLFSGTIDTSKSIIVSGFWRSGTTWLQQLLASVSRAKSVFEPFYPEVLWNHKTFIYRNLPNKSSCFLQTYMPFYEHDFSTNLEMKSFLDKVITSDIKSVWLRRGRKNISDSFHRRTVIKMVRGQLCLNAIHKTFHCTIVHIYRDPRAILASVKRGNWWKDWLDSFSLREQLLEQPDNRNTFFGKWKEDIVRYDRQSPEQRVVAYWALTELYVQHCISQYGTPINFICYDDLYSHGKQIIYNILDRVHLSYDKKEEIDLDMPSSTSRHKRDLLSFEQKKNSWKNELKPRISHLAESIAVRFGLEDRLKQ